MPDAPPTPLREIAFVFTKLGATAFGGPAVHIALLEQEVVHRRKWLTHAEFLDLLGAANLIPGPNSTELAIHIGLRRGGWRGLLIAGACFIIPAFLIVLACAWFYVRYARLPAIQGILYGVKPVVLAIVLQALWRLSRSALRTKIAIALAVASLVAAALGVHELIVLVAAGVLAIVLARLSPARRTETVIPSIAWFTSAFPASLLTTAPAVTSVPFGLGSLFLFFLKVGAVLYGSGYVLLAFLRADLVERWGWLTEAQLLDAVAIGQVTPGPLFTTATFIGYVLGESPGAALATLGIFLPAFIFVFASAPLIPRLRKSPIAAAFLDGVNAASLALMAVVTVQLLGGAMVDTTTIALGVVAAIVLLTTRLNPVWLIVAAGAMGLMMR